MNFSQAAGAAAIAGIGTAMNSGTIKFYSGSMPATPETALSGNTELVIGTFASTALAAATLVSGTPNYMQANASFVNNNPTADNSGTIGFARVFKSDGTTVIADLTVATTGTPDISVPSLVTASGTAYPIASFTVKQAVV